MLEIAHGRALVQYSGGFELQPGGGSLELQASDKAGGEETAKFWRTEQGDRGPTEALAGGGQWPDPVPGWPVQLSWGRRQSEAVNGEDRKSCVCPPWSAIMRERIPPVLRVEPAESVTC